MPDPRLEEVFKLSGLPTYTFVEPPEYKKLLVSLRKLRGEITLFLRVHAEIEELWPGSEDQFLVADRTAVQVHEMVVLDVLPEAHVAQDARAGLYRNRVAHGTEAR